MSDRDIDVLARTIYGEARGESISGMEAVASVVLNREAFSKRRRRYWWKSAASRSSFPAGIAMIQIIVWFQRFRIMISSFAFARELPRGLFPDCWKIKPAAPPITIPNRFGRFGQKEKFLAPKSVATFFITILNKEK